MDNKLIREIKTSCEGLIRFGVSEDHIIARLEKEYSDVGVGVLADIVVDTVQEYKNYGLIQKIMRSDLVCDQLGEDNNITILDKRTRTVSKINRSRLSELFDKRMNIKNKIAVCEFEYRPYDSGMLIRNEDDTFSFNTYEPPKWFMDYFYDSKNCTIPNSELPDLYRKFFMHLVNADKDSYVYLLKWLSNGLRSRNYCILATIGQQGVGKGVLGNIMRELFGSHNFHAGSDRMFKGTFNSQLANKRLVYCDEISIKNKEDEDKMKLVVNDHLEIEQKGIDAKEIRNYANFYISSNNMDSISLTADDRRFSIIELTDKKLSTLFTSDQINQLFDEDNIAKLAGFLWHYPVSEQEMLSVFVSQRTEEVRSASLKEWEDWFVFKFCQLNKGKTFDVWEIADKISDEFGYKFRVGRNRLKELTKKYPDSFKVYKKNVDGIQTWLVEVYEDKKNKRK